jgi:hypothetical protein
MCGHWTLVRKLADLMHAVAQKRFLLKVADTSHENGTGVAMVVL